MEITELTDLQKIEIFETAREFIKTDTYTGLCASFEDAISGKIKCDSITLALKIVDQYFAKYREIYYKDYWFSNDAKGKVRRLQILDIEISELKKEIK